MSHALMDVPVYSLAGTNMVYIAQTLSKHYADWYVKTLPEQYLNCFSPWILNPLGSKITVPSA